MATSQPTSSCRRLWCPPRRPHALYERDKLIKAIIAQMVCALFYSKAVRDGAQRLVATVEKMETEKGGVSYRGCSRSTPFRLILTLYVTPPIACVCSSICVKSQGWRFKWPGVCTWNPWALIFSGHAAASVLCADQRSCLTIRAWNAAELPANAPAWCFLPTTVHLTFSKSLLQPCPRGNTHTHAV